MPQIFVFTAGNPEARQHLADSIENLVDDAVVFGNFDERHHEELQRIKDEGRGFYAWGAVWGVRNRPTWEQMERDDFVLCVYDATYRYVANVRGAPAREVLIPVDTTLTPLSAQHLVSQGNRE